MLCSKQIVQIFLILGQNKTCLQSVLNQFCENLGTDDEHIVRGEHSHCNDKRFARFDGDAWRCWTELLEETSLACVGQDGQLIMCSSPDTSGGKCTRNSQLQAIIDDRVALCAGKFVSRIKLSIEFLS